MLHEATGPVAIAPFGSKELETLIASASAVSFDFFDTLFVRPLINPEDAFEIIGRRFGLADFRAQRSAAQAEAFRRMGAAGRKEITLSDIYSCLPELTTPSSELLQAEYELELTLIEPNPEVFALLFRLLDAGTKVVIASDMYLPVSFFVDALRPYGLEHMQLFVSADLNATKRDKGELFDVVSEQLKLAAGTILHIGDNYISDVVRPREKRMMAYHYQRERVPPIKKTASLMTSIGYGLLSASARGIPQDSYSEVGFVYGGAANFGFLEWIKEQARSDRVDQILFLSRDGYTLQRIAAEDPAKGIPRSCYFLGSRTTYALASMNAENFEAYIPFLLSGADGLAPCEVLERIGVQPPSPKIMADFGMGGDTRITPRLHPRLSSFLYAIRWEILKVCRRNRHCLFRYLREAGVKPGSRVAVVDVGWNGTTQEAFEVAVRPLMDIDVIGYYFCLANTPERLQRSGSQKMSALINEVNTSPEIVADIYANRVAVEQFFSAPHSSIIGLQIGSHGVEPVMDVGRGNTAELQRLAHEVCLGAEAFAMHFKTFQRRINLKATPLETVWPLIELLSDTQSNAYQLLGRIRNFDAWGSSRNHELKLANYLPTYE